MFYWFQLTSSRRGWHAVLAYRIDSCVFQLTSSRRGWPCHGCRTVLSRTYFNSHPHEEDDFPPVFLLLSCYISTHILTKRMTWLSVLHFLHTIFQLTSSRRGWRSNCTCSDSPERYFNSHPHEEDDMRSDVETGRTIISTHILTKRMTILYDPLETQFDSFQLTSSRRGWPALCFAFLTPSNNFNSHPHEEDDGLPVNLSVYLIISTHILTKRMTAILNKNNLFKIAYYISNKHFISIVDIFFHFHIYF